MYNHAPDGYVCPICLMVDGVESDQTWIKQGDIFYRDDLVVGFISSKFIAGNEGHALIVPVEHFENLYDLPDAYARRVMEVSKKTAEALKNVRSCDGVNIVQNNEPAADQHAFRYHMHVVPRFVGDTFHVDFWQTRKSEPEERIAYATPLRDFFRNQ